MIRLTIISKIPDNYGHIFRADISPEDKFDEVIERVATSANIPYEPRLFLKTDQGETVKKSAKVSFYLNSTSWRSPLELHTYRVSRARWTCAILALLMGLLALIVSSWAFKNPRDILTPTRRGVAIDAGSSHTSFTLYEWPSMNAWLQPNELKLVGNCYENFGIDDFRSDPDIVGRKFRPCLDAIYELLQMNMTDTVESAVSVYLGATAGMRLLNLTEPDVAEKLLKSAETAILASGGWQVADNDLRILSGSEEAIFGWISANIFAGSLGAENTPATFSALDLGGGSAQKINSCKGKNCSDWQTLYLFGGVYDVTSSSALCYGLEEAMKRFTAGLIYKSYSRNNKTLQTAITNPCLDRRFTRDTWLPEFHKSFGEIFDTPCTRINDPEFMEIVGSHQNFKIEHVEVVNTFEHCDEELRNLLDFGQCSFAECFDFDNAKNVPEEETFYAMGAYIWVMNFLNMSNTIALEDALDQVRSICDSPEPSTNGETDCFELSYVLNILTRGYGFTAKTFKNIKFLPEYGDSVDWTLGLMASVINRSGIVKPEERISRVAYILVAFFSIALILLSGIALVTFWQRQYVNYSRNL